MCQSSFGQSTGPSRRTRLKLSTVEQRHQAACTHLNITRLFDTHDSQRCYICGRKSPLGWLYRCTQDYNSFLPKSDLYPVGQEDDQSSSGGGFASSQLSQSILLGIKHGLYHGQQIEMLEAQKLRVVESIAIHEEEMEDSSDSSESSSSYYITSNSTLESPSSTAADISELPRHSGTSTCDQVYQDAAMEAEVPISADSTLETPRVAPLLTNCQFRCCPNCRPAYRDRAFQSLDALLREPFQPPPPWEVENRRISNARLLRTMSASLPRPQLRRMYQKYDDLKDITGTQSAQGGDSEAIHSTINVSKGKTRGRKGFRATVRKAFDALDSSKNGREASQQSSSSSSGQTSIQLSRPVLLKRRRKDTKQQNAIVSNQALQESLILMLAANTPLPRASEGSEGPGVVEIQVEDGVAVTEEGVELEAADIIVQN